MYNETLQCIRNEEDPDLNLVIIIVPSIIGGIIIIGLVVGGIIYWYRRKKRKAKSKSSVPSLPTDKDLLKATVSEPFVS